MSDYSSPALSFPSHLQHTHIAIAIRARLEHARENPSAGTPQIGPPRIAEITATTKPKADKQINTIPRLRIIPSFLSPYIRLMSLLAVVTSCLILKLSLFGRPSTCPSSNHLSALKNTPLFSDFSKSLSISPSEELNTFTSVFWSGILSITGDLRTPG